MPGVARRGDLADQRNIPRVDNQGVLFNRPGDDKVGDRDSTGPEPKVDREVNVEAGSDSGRVQRVPKRNGQNLMPNCRGRAHHEAPVEELDAVVGLAERKVVLLRPGEDMRERLGCHDVSLPRDHSGMLPCLRGGTLSRLVRSVRSARTTCTRVADGSMTESTYPRSAATYGLASVSSYSSTSRVRREAGSAADASSAGLDVTAGVGDRLELAAVDDVGGALGAHHGDLSGGPGQVDVGAEVLGAHHVVRAAVGLAGDHGEFGHGGLAVRVEQLRAAPDDAVPLLSGTGKETGHVDERQYRKVERVAGAHEPGRLLRRGDVQAAGEVHRLVGHHTDRPPLHPAEADHDVLRVQRLYLQEVLDHRLDHPVHVVRLVGRVRNQRVQFQVGLGRRGRERVRRHLVEVVRWQEGQQRLDVLDRVLLRRRQVVRVAGGRVVGTGAAQLLEPDVLAGDRLDHVRAGDEHV